MLLHSHTFGLRYDWQPFKNISPQLALAVIAAEDQRFAQHHGFDFQAIKQAWRDYQNGKPLRGASTISQQVAKNLYLWPQRSLLRKGLESWFTILIELFWSKRRILEVYLNIVQFGDGVFGAEAASQYFFERPASALTRQQAALMAAILPGPAIYHIDAPSPHIQRKQAWIVQQIGQLGGLNYLNKL